MTHFGFFLDLLGAANIDGVGELLRLNNYLVTLVPLARLSVVIFIIWDFTTWLACILYIWPVATSTWLLLILHLRGETVIFLPQVSSLL